MKSFIICLLLCSAGFLIGQETQTDFQKIMSRYGYNVFRPTQVGFNYFYDIAGEKDTAQFHIGVSIQHDFLQFLKEDEFISKYQLNLIIKKEERIILSNTWQEELKLDEFVKTNSFKDFQFLNYMVSLKDYNIAYFKPGEYDIIVEVRDLQSSISYKNVRKMKIPKDKKTDQFQTHITFLSTPADSISDLLKISNMRDHLDFNTPYTAFVRPPANIDKTSAVNVRLYKKDKQEKILRDQKYCEITMTKNKRLMTQYDLPYTVLEEGNYLIRFSISNDSVNYQAEKEFTVLWLWKPLYLYKVDLAVRPMKYLLSNEEMEKIKEFDLEELEPWFKDYWKENDPTPETLFNEKQNFYFKRVSEAVRLYSSRDQEGWQTDFGKILILYGEPTKIENRKYSVNSFPHVVWKYIFDGETYEFKFVDETKSGKFKLVD